MSDVCARRPALPARFIFEEMDVYRFSGVMEAAVAAFAMMAKSSELPASSARRKLRTVMRGEPLLAPFSHADILDEYRQHEANYDLDADIAGEIAIEKIEPMRGRPREVQAILHVVRAAMPAETQVPLEQLRTLALIQLVLRAGQISRSGSGEALHPPA